MRFPSEISEDENTTFVAERIDLITVNERHFFNCEEFPEGQDIVHTTNPEWEQYKEQTSLHKRVLDLILRRQPSIDIWIGIDRTDVDFDQSSEVVFTVTPFNREQQFYQEVSHTVKKGKKKNPPEYTSSYRELADHIRKIIGNLF